MPTSRNPILLLCLALLMTTTAVYWPGLHGSFLFDDFPNIVTNARVQPSALTWEAIKTAASGYEPGYYGRPLATISFALDYLVGGKNAHAFKLTSLAVHLVNALLVFWLLRRLFALPRATDPHAWPNVAAFAIALAWAIHPIQISSVLYIVQRMETLALTFVLLALVAYLRGRIAQCDGRDGWHWLFGSALLAGAGMLSKETAILFPSYALALELTVLRFDAASPRTSKLLKGAFAFASLATAAVFLGWVLPEYMAPEAFKGRDFNLYERLLSQLRVLPMYLGQILLPLPSSLTFYYDNYVKSTGWLHPATTLAGGVLLLGLLGAGWGLRSRMPLVALGILWFFAAHLLTSNVFTLELAFEHRNYFALLGVLVALADLVRRIPTTGDSKLKYLGVAIVILGFGLLATLRSAIWGNPLLLASDLVAKNPQSPRASSDLATLYVGMSGSNPDSPFFDFGMREFERGSLLPNASPLPEQGMILMAATTGQPVKDEWWSRLIQKVETRPVSPQETMAVTGLLKQRYAGIPLDDRRLSQAYQSLLGRGGQPAQMYAQFGDYALKYLNDEGLADKMFVSSIEQNPTDADYANQIISALIGDGRQRQARLVFERARQLGLVKTVQENPPK